jgi:hypothetical protein
VSGRYEQLGRQLRKARAALAKNDQQAISVALRRAKHLAIDLVLERVESDDVSAGLVELATKTVVTPALVDRLSREFTSEHDPARELDGPGIVALGRDLDCLLRSLEHDAAMPELPFVALAAVDVPPAESRVALTISGRHIVVAGRGGEGLVFVDDRPTGRPFTLPVMPTSKAEIHRDRSGRTRISWGTERLVVELGPDFATVEARASA